MQCVEGVPEQRSRFIPRASLACSRRSTLLVPYPCYLPLSRRSLATNATEQRKGGTTACDDDRVDPNGGCRGVQAPEGGPSALPAPLPLILRFLPPYKPTTVPLLDRPQLFHPFSRPRRRALGSDLLSLAPVF
jgi:hypothetical protein